MTERTVAVLSDVHGNAVALEAVLAEVAAAGPGLVVVGGDLTWGPLPEATLELVHGLTTPAVFVRGNAERVLLEPDGEHAERRQWLLERHSREALEFLGSFVEQAVVEVEGLGAVRFCHGSPRADNEVVTPETPATRIRAMTDGIGEKVLVTAHTHLQFDRTVEGIRSINAGSVGLAYGQAAGTASLGAARPRRRAAPNALLRRGNGSSLPGDRRPRRGTDARDAPHAAHRGGGDRARRATRVLGLTDARHGKRSNGHGTSAR